MFTKFKIEESEDVLLLTLKQSGSSMDLVRELVILSIGFLIVFNLSYEWLINVSSLLLLVYFLPLFRLPWIIQKSKALHTPILYRFDKVKDEFSIDGIAKNACSEITVFAINYYTAHDSDEVYLDLAVTKKPHHRLSSGGWLNIKEYKKVGRALARFNEVECGDNHPTEKELIWGSTQASDGQINALNYHHGND